jgi:hypothetical protein
MTLLCSCRMEKATPLRRETASSALRARLNPTVVNQRWLLQLCIVGTLQHCFQLAASMIGILLSSDTSKHFEWPLSPYVFEALGRGL